MKYFPKCYALHIENKFPKIYKALHLLWGEREFNTYISTLFLHDRPNRKGFPIEVMRDLCELQKEHNKQFPHLIYEDKWDNSYLEKR
jgi:hypothetical protein